MRWTFVVVVLGFFALIAYVVKLRSDAKKNERELEFLRGEKK